MQRAFLVLCVMTAVACGASDPPTAGSGGAGSGGTGSGATGGSGGVSGSSGSGATGGMSGSGGDDLDAGVVDAQVMDAMQAMFDAGRDGSMLDGSMDATQSMFDAGRDGSMLDGSMDATQSMFDAADEEDSGEAGAGGTGGGGTGGGCASPVPNGARCPDLAEGWYAIKTVVDVWWQGVPTRDPGRGTIELYQLVEIDSVCSEEPNGIGRSKVCGLQLPTLTSDVVCEAFQLQIPDSAWESSVMPQFATAWSTSAFEPGATVTLAQVTRLLGIDLMDAQTEGTWPTAAQTDTFMCELGIGQECADDHDNDGRSGITLRVRADAAVYSYSDVDEGGVARANSDANYGRCTQGAPYRYRGLPTGVDVAAGGGAGGGVRAVSVQAGTRVSDGSSFVANNDCASGSGPANVARVDLRAFDCGIDPLTLNPYAIPADPRVTSMSDQCTGTESTFLDEALPAFQVLTTGAMPGNSLRPNGWTLYGREIDKRPSEGSRSAAVRLADIVDAEPTCAQVRNAAFTDL